MKTIASPSVALVLLTVLSADAYAPSLFQAPTKTAPSSSKEGVLDIELPNLDELLSRIKTVSPLARQVIENGGKMSKKRGLEYIDDTGPLKWKVMEQNQKRTVHHIDKIDNFMKLGAPVLRFRASLRGPCLGEPFADFIMTLDQRERWDNQIAQVDELHPIHHDAANEIIGDSKFGDCSRLGVGYCQTKANLGISPREQLTMCGVQDFEDGSCVIWGTEMEEQHNFLLPEGQRHPRAKSHLFCTTLTPTGEDTFDVEYVLQMETGGLPAFITTPVMVDTVKSLFKHAEAFYVGGEGSELHRYLAERADYGRLLVAENDEVPEEEMVLTTDAEHHHHLQIPTAALNGNDLDALDEALHNRLVENHSMVMIHDDKPKSFFRRLVHIAAVNAEAAKSKVQSMVDKVAADLILSRGFDI